jgi:NAD(P)-dependent dehydrogenase (short-subunit alcohol dehydrogenase family)
VSISKDTLLGRMGTAEEVANVLCFLLSDEASYVTGGECAIRHPCQNQAESGGFTAHWNVDGGYLAC